jgi:predicted ATP-dependent serine protease
MARRKHLNGSIPTADEWAEVVDRRPKVAHLIDDILPDSPGDFSIIGGRTGIGKTNLQMQMALSLAT